MDAVKLDAARGQARPMNVVIVGRIEDTKTHEGNRYTRVICPAADAYSKPQIIEIRSKSRIGDKADEGKWTCILGGYMRKPYQVRDEKTGEITKVHPVEMTLDLVESD
jgi:hypothetical protein